MQGEFPAGLDILFSGSARHFQNVVGNACQCLAIFDDMHEGIGGVEQVLLELGGKRSQLLLYFHEALLFRLGQFCATEAEVAQFVFDDFFLGFIEQSVPGCSLQRLELPEQALMLAELGIVLGDLGQVLVVDRAQLGRVHHAVQVRDLAPGARQMLVGVFHGGHEGLPGWLSSIGCTGFHYLARVGQQLVHGGSDVFGADLGKTGQAGKIEQGIHGKNLMSQGAENGD